MTTIQRANGTGLTTRTSVKAGGLDSTNHSQSGMPVRSRVKAGESYTGGNHNQSGIAVRTRVKAGTGWTGNNHNQSGIALKYAE
jgi:hypothetical protein